MLKAWAAKVSDVLVAYENLFWPKLFRRRWRYRPQRHLVEFRYHQSHARGAGDTMFQRGHRQAAIWRSPA